MCVGKCSRFIGLCLVVLSVMAITLSLFLLFPNFDGSYLKKNLISHYAIRMPGIWAGGVMVLLSGIQTSLAGFKVKICSCCGPRCDMLVSIVLSSLALMGASVCLIVITAGLAKGPFCLYEVNMIEGAMKEKWDYPFMTADPQIFNNSAHIQLFDIVLWSTVCIEPPHIVTWNSSLGLSLCLINLLQILLSISQLINAFFGVIGGHCDPKKTGPSDV
ncbi:transmembrane 4 L6 family member 19 [Bombina bombina]|uniref:transmembrane 4 L6 family member 19 n=1 Tax=Bombina bombina TaxID=8345 RepID=UPI00235A4B9C|nr:transmembrane 4 L6 family member 19 [Bombina bombina]